MSRRQLPRGTSAQLDAATFLPGEIAVDTTNDELRYDGDGSTVGGIAVARKDGANASATATGGSTANTLANRFGWQLHLQDFGAAVPDNSTDATTTTNLANTAGGRIVVPITSAGSVYATTHDEPYADLTNAVWLGPGRIEINGYAQAPFRSIITSAQTAPASNDRYRFFNEGFPKANRASFMGVYGSSVTGTPGATYNNFEELAYDVLVYDNTAGFNTEVDTHDEGRSGIHAQHWRLYQGGQGDLLGRYTYMEGYSARSGATHFLANPAIVVEGGNLGISSSAGAGTYMCHSEYVFADNGNRAACIGHIRNYVRDSAATTLGEVWIHDRPQATGSQAADAVYAPGGSWKRGLDFTPATFDTDKAAVVLKDGDRIYFGSSSAADSSGAKWFATTLGSAYIYGTSTDIRSSVAGTNSASLVTVGGTQTLTNKSVQDSTFAIVDNSDATKQVKFEASGVTTATTRTMTVPDANGTLMLTSTPAAIAQLGNTSYSVSTINFVITGVNFNSANTDNAINISLPTGFTRYLINSVRTVNCTGTLNAVTIGVFTATGGGGTAVVTGGSGVGVTTGSDTTNGNAGANTVNNPNTLAYKLTDVPTIYYRVQNAQGTATTGTVILQITPIP